MGTIDDDHQRRRLKWWVWIWKRLRNPRVLKTVLWTGVVIYRIARWMYEVWSRISG